MTQKKIYLSGPMTGLPDFNYPLFNHVAARLREAGHTVYNPAEFEHDEPVFPMRKAFAAYCNFICCEACTIVMLPGWQNSKGASIEHALASYLNLEVEYA